MDLFMTVLDAAEIELDEATRHRISSPGRSVLPVLADPTAEWRKYRFAEHGNARFVADASWKLVQRYPPLDTRFGDELYNLQSDSRETVNLIDEEGPSLHRAVLSEALQEYFARYEDPDKSGRRIMEQPPANGREPWTRLAARLSEPE